MGINIKELNDELGRFDNDAQVEVLVDGCIVGKVVLVANEDDESYIEVRNDDEGMSVRDFKRELLSINDGVVLDVLVDGSDEGQIVSVNGETDTPYLEVRHEE